MNQLPYTRYDFKFWVPERLVNFDGGTAPWECLWVMGQIEQIAGHILEIGTHLGGTMRQWARNFPTRQFICVDKCDPNYGLKPEEVGSRYRECPNVTLRLVDSKEFTYPDGVGVVFIDGDHSWDGVKADTQKALDHFRRNQGIIIWHDYNPEHEVMPYLNWLHYTTGLNIRQVQFTTLAYLRIG